MDWNRDGKHDWQDDAIYNNLINPDRGPKDTATSENSYKHTYNKGHQDLGPIYTDENKAAAKNSEWVQNVLKAHEKFQKEQDELYKAHPEWIRKERPKDNFGQASRSNQNIVPSSQKQSFNSSGQSFRLGTLSKIVMVMTVLLCIVSLFIGNADTVGTTLGIGAVAFLIVRLLEG
jgi:hypothetical protein